MNRLRHAAAIPGHAREARDANQTLYASLNYVEFGATAIVAGRKK